MVRQIVHVAACPVGCSANRAVTPVRRPPLTVGAMKRVLFILLSAIFLTSCGISNKTVFEGPPNSEAEAEYRQAVKTLEDGAYEESVRHFHDIKLKYPYATRWATLCDLRIADAYRYSGDYAQAAVAYQSFVRTYPAHADIPYASYQAANSYYELMPSDIFILPDPWQRDSKSTVQAQTAFQVFLARYPDDENAPKAREQLAEVRRRLAERELYIAEYNFKNEAYRGAVARLDGLVRTYPDFEKAPKAHILLAHSFLKLHDPVSAKAALLKLIEQYPEAPEVADAKSWIERNKEVP